MEALLAISFSKFAFVMLYTNTSIILVKKNLLWNIVDALINIMFDVDKNTFVTPDQNLVHWRYSDNYWRFFTGFNGSNKFIFHRNHHEEFKIGLKCVFFPSSSISITITKMILSVAI